MTDNVENSVRAYLRVADVREVDMPQFFAERGLETQFVDPQNPDRTLLIVFEGTRGTAVVPIRQGLGPQVMWEVVPIYFDGERDLIIRGIQVSSFPELEFVDGSWKVLKKGLIKPF